MDRYILEIVMKKSSSIKAAAVKLRDAIEKLTCCRIYIKPPIGVDLKADILRLLPKYRPDTIIDVGANIGQSARKFIEWFPHSMIYCFEPVSSTFSDLTKNLCQYSNIRCFQLALGKLQGKGKMRVDGSSLGASMLKADDIPPGATIEQVDLTTLDKFCEQQRLGHISFLKIDTEGHDLDVLKGADNLLGNQKIDVIQVEAGMNPQNIWHVPIETLSTHLQKRSYFLFGIYEQVNFWNYKEPHMLRSDPVFISMRVIEQNRIRIRT